MNTYAIIIDDEPNVSKALELIIEDEFPEINLIANCTSAKEGREVIARNQVEFIFLDINMARPKTAGFFVTFLPFHRSYKRFNTTTCFNIFTKIENLTNLTAYEGFIYPVER